MTYAAGAAGLPKAIRLNSNTSRVFVAFVALCLVAVIAFLAGEKRASSPAVLTGIPVIAQNHVATITVGGWSYGITGAVTWFDSQGTMHESSWPGCLSGTGPGRPITFAAVPVTAPGGGSWRQVVWVKC